MDYIAGALVHVKKMLSQKFKSWTQKKMCNLITTTSKYYTHQQRIKIGLESNNLMLIRSVCTKFDL